jgi:hypothetical protein
LEKSPILNIAGNPLEILLLEILIFTTQINTQYACVLLFYLAFSVDILPSGESQL